MTKKKAAKRKEAVWLGKGQGPTNIKLDVGDNDKRVYLKITHLVGYRIRRSFVAEFERDQNTGTIVWVNTSNVRNGACLIDVEKNEKDVLDLIRYLMTNVVTFERSDADTVSWIEINGVPPEKCPSLVVKPRSKKQRKTA